MVTRDTINSYGIIMYLKLNILIKFVQYVFREHNGPYVFYLLLYITSFTTAMHNFCSFAQRYTVFVIKHSLN